MEHPSLSTCQQFLKPENEGQESTESPGDESAKLSSSSSIASYIKSITRWMNSWIYAVVANFLEAVRSLVKVMLSYTVGIILSIGGKTEVCEPDHPFHIFIRGILTNCISTFT